MGVAVGVRVTGEGGARLTGDICNGGGGDRGIIQLFVLELGVRKEMSLPRVAAMIT